MFKFIWIIMIVFVVGVFAAYTIICCIQEAEDAESLQDWWDNMYIDHDVLLLVWEVIFIISAIILFVASFVAFTSSFG